MTTTPLEDRIRTYATALDAATTAAVADPSQRHAAPVVELAVSPRRPVPRRNRRLLAIAAVVLFALLAGALALLTLGRDDGGDPVSTVTSVAAPTTTLVPTTSVVPASTTSTTPTSTAGASAAGALAPFFREATEIDRRLRTAAAAVNAGTGPTGVHVTPAAVATIGTADPTPVAAIIPAGLSPRLLRAVLVVWSELDSRYMAMSCLPTGNVTNADLAQSGCLTGGTEAARRFPADLAAAKTLAAAEPVPPAVAPSSRTVAELGLQIDAIEKSNGGCASVGGHILTNLLPIVWQPVVNGVGRFDGTIGGMLFNATYSSSSGWTTRINVC
jgi:hypothetical protein